MTPIDLAESTEAPVDQGPVLEARDLRVWYGTDRGPVKAVDGVSFGLRRGEILGLVGESGCGKSTLGRGLLGLLPDGAARDGELRFQGRDMLTLKAKEQHAHARLRPRHDLPGATDAAEPVDADLRALRGDAEGPQQVDHQGGGRAAFAGGAAR